MKNNRNVILLITFLTIVITLMPAACTTPGKLNIKNAIVGESPFIISQNIIDCYDTNISLRQELSGSPAYIIGNAVIICLGLNILRDESNSSKYTVIIPAEFMNSLLDRNNIDWEH
jgi:hypothetical protein